MRASTPAWVRDAICWQVYPLGFCGAPRRREDLVGQSYGEGAGENVVHRLGRLMGWLDHLVSLGANVLILNPIADSVSHGYDTLDHQRVDPRLGDQHDFQALVTACHERGIRIVLDGVFNHVSEHHAVARAAVAAGPGTVEGGRIRWAGEHPYGFEGNADLVEMDLADEGVQEAVLEVMSSWLQRGADGWRLDAMYAAGPQAWAPILARLRDRHPEAWILGEVIHGDYPAFAAASGADSVTQYELWKGIWSSLHDHNLFELAHALGRHQAFREQAGGRFPLIFLGNHDTTRIASQLPDSRDLAAAICLLALLPGIPAVYAGDELGAVGVKEQRAGGDDAVRPVFPDDPADAPTTLALLKEAAAPRILEAHRRMLALRRREPWLADARIEVREETLTSTYAEIVLSPSARLPIPPLTLALNLGEEDAPAAGEVVEVLSGAAIIDGLPAPAPGTVPAHGAAVLR
ncbi:alpha-amylase family glycosyl hydrolase [Brachybacterium hainanense]|uniref:Alpha-amylase family glycosyl hydrolase n=1 Tax=Brachybacterium hainanense TaxID=1541174 RepID=A0ABV6RD05_9MICO